ncbi:MAG: hypothetical protein H6793_00635 [Candidatus Nomurabacteria bacterium]|nr:hypothetical protein [Candidatus Saccharibacteria bacterium]USN95663.1 MAG: hypothetical protein H6793_00635 [Candidatus Nomurabacteria bacterium]
MELLPENPEEILRTQIDKYFELDVYEEIKVKELIDDISDQHEFDEMINDLTTNKRPGLRKEIAFAIVEADDHLLANLYSNAQERAIIGMKIRLCRQAVSRIMYDNRYQTGTSQSKIVQSM